jgi:hypothetical protein
VRDTTVIIGSAVIVSVMVAAAVIWTIITAGGFASHQHCGPGESFVLAEKGKWVCAKVHEPGS